MPTTLSLLWSKYTFYASIALTGRLLALECLIVFVWSMSICLIFKLYVEEVDQAHLASLIGNETNYERDQLLASNVDWFVEVAGLARTSIGTLLFFLITFRSSQAYSRWWEGRCLWGRHMNNAWTLSQQACSWIEDTALCERVVHHIIAFGYLEQSLLRHGENAMPSEDLAELLPAAEVAFIATLKMKPLYCLDVIRAIISNAMEKTSHPNTCHPKLMSMEGMTQDLSRCLGGCMRVRNSPVPSVHTSFQRTFALLYCLVAPVAGFDASHGNSGIVSTSLVVTLFAWLIFGVQSVADMLEEPFGADSCDLNLEAFNSFIRTNCLLLLSRYRGDKDEKGHVPWELVSGPPEVGETTPEGSQDGAIAAKCSKMASVRSRKTTLAPTFGADEMQQMLFRAQRPRAETRLMASQRHLMAARSKKERSTHALLTSVPSAKSVVSDGGARPTPSGYSRKKLLAPQE